MRIAILGAGAIGGYFGARLLEAGRDVTFLVRATRSEELARHGLIVKSPRGNVTLENPPTIAAEKIDRPFDLILLCCKAYDLGGAIDTVRRAVGPDSAILPLLNGMGHLSELANAFGANRVLGGQCVIATQLNHNREIVQLTDQQSFSFGEQDGSSSPRIQAIAKDLDVVNVEARLSGTIILDMWQKWAMLATMAGMTCLMRATIGDILATPNGREWISGTFEDCCQIAQAEGFPLPKSYTERTLTTLLTRGSSLTASMLRDIESQGRVEADHVLGDLIDRRRRFGLKRPETSLLEVAYSHVKAYDLRRTRTLAPG